jgi:hypothetical protein
MQNEKNKPIRKKKERKKNRKGKSIIYYKCKSRNQKKKPFIKK